MNIPKCDDCKYLANRVHHSLLSMEFGVYKLCSQNEKLSFSPNKTDTFIGKGFKVYFCIFLFKPSPHIVCILIYFYDSL